MMKDTYKYHLKMGKKVVHLDPATGLEYEPELNDWRAAYEERNDQIRKARAAGVSAAQLAQEFGVSIWTIHWVLRQKVKA